MFIKIIHTISRDMNEMPEAVTRRIPMYMTGMIGPYCYPRLKDGVFQRTLFLTPSTAAVVSSSVQPDTDGMLNLFLTDNANGKSVFLHYTLLSNISKASSRETPFPSFACDRLSSIIALKDSFVMLSKVGNSRGRVIVKGIPFVKIIWR